MKKLLFSVSAAAVCLLAACSKNTAEVTPAEEETIVEEVSVIDAPPTYISARNVEEEPTPKSSIDGTTSAFTWSAGDQAAVFSGSWRISSELEATYGGTNNATFEFPAGINEGRADFAVFPASLVFNGSSVRPNSATYHTASALTISLPASYTLTQVQDDAVPTPMIATNAPDGELAFKQLCALLRLTLNNVPKQTRSITVDFNGKKVQGEFTLSNVTPGTTVIETADTDNDDDIVTVLTPDITEFTSGLVINIPLPAGTYGKVTVTTLDEGGHKINALTQPVKKTGNQTWSPARKSFGKRTVILPVFTLNADGKKVVFAPGNLQAVIGTAAVANGTPAVASQWKFASEQYDCIGRGTTSGDGGTNHANLAEGATVDLFCFVGASATYDSYGLVIAQDASSAAHYGNVASETLKSDFGHNVIEDYAPDTWETPLSAEQVYVFTGRQSGVLTTLNGKPARYVRIKIKDVPTFYNATAATNWKAAPFTHRFGLLLFPDKYEHPSDVALPPADNINAAKIKWEPGETDTKLVEYTVSDWEKLEAAGCVFFPAAGIRQYNGGKWQIGQLNAWAYYLCKNGNAATTNIRLAGQPTDTYFNAGGSARNNGSAVRLQRQVN